MPCCPGWRIQESLAFMPESVKKELGYLGVWEEALRVCNERVRRIPTKADLYSHKAIILTRLRRYRSALATVREALRTAKPNPVFGYAFSDRQSKSTGEST